MDVSNGADQKRKGLKMAKVRQQNSIMSAITAITAAVRVEADGNLTPEQKSEAINGAMDVIDNSGIMTVAEVADDNVETMHQVEAVLEAGGVDMVEIQRRAALANADAVVEAEQARIAEAEQAAQLEAGE